VIPWSRFDGDVVLPVGLYDDGSKHIMVDMFRSWLLADISAGQLIHPQRSPSEVDSMAAKGHDLYCLTSGDYLPGEQRTRYYAHPSYDPCRRFGIQFTVNVVFIRTKIYRNTHCYHDYS